MYGDENPLDSVVVLIPPDPAPIDVRVFAQNVQEGVLPEVSYTYVVQPTGSEFFDFIIHRYLNDIDLVVAKRGHVKITPAYQSFRQRFFDRCPLADFEKIVVDILKTVDRTKFAIENDRVNAAIAEFYPSEYELLTYALGSQWINILGIEPGRLSFSINQDINLKKRIGRPRKISTSGTLPLDVSPHPADISETTSSDNTMAGNIHEYNDVQAILENPPKNLTLTQWVSLTHRRNRLEAVIPKDELFQTTKNKDRRITERTLLDLKGQVADARNNPKVTVFVDEYIKACEDCARILGLSPTTNEISEYLGISE